jgi:hypothetical protein
MKPHELLRQAALILPRSINERNTNCRAQTKTQLTSLARTNAFHALVGCEFAMAGLLEIGQGVPRLIGACVISSNAYGHVFTSRVRAMGIRDRPISPQSPWQNGYAERLIGTRRECLDQMVIFGETHLRRILSAYTAYYNQARTHLALQKDAPLHRAVQQSGAIVAIPILAGLHHQYVRI